MRGFEAVVETAGLTEAEDDKGALDAEEDRGCLDVDEDRGAFGAGAAAGLDGASDCRRAGAAADVPVEGAFATEPGLVGLVGAPALTDFFRAAVADAALLAADDATPLEILDTGAALTEPAPNVPELRIYEQLCQEDGNSRIARRTFLTKGVGGPAILLPLVLTDIPGFGLVGLLVVVGVESSFLSWSAGGLARSSSAKAPSDCDGSAPLVLLSPFSTTGAANSTGASSATFPDSRGSSSCSP